MTWVLMGGGYIIASALTDRLAPRTGCTDTSASSGTICEQSIGRPRSGRH